MRTLNQASALVQLPKWAYCAFAIYIFLSFFETYLVGFGGSTTKFYLLGIIVMIFFYSRGNVYFNSVNVLVVIWLAIKIASLLWSSLSNFVLVQTHALSQIGMTLFFVVITGINIETKFASFFTNSTLVCSFIFGLASIAFPGSFLDERYVARQVLTLFGLQNDPNNCAVFLLIGIAIAGHRLFIERKQLVICAAVIIVNAYALLLTSSRGGFLTLAVIFTCIVFSPRTEEKLRVYDYAIRLLLIIIVLAAAYYVIDNFLPQASLDRILDFSDYSGGSGRDIRWEKAWSYFISNPLFGCGWGGYNSGGEVVHNTLLTSLCDGGIVGTLPFLCAIGLIAAQSLKHRRPLPILLLASVIVPALFIDVINKRFFWNTLALAFLLSYCGDTTSSGHLLERNRSE